jgi:hypothetical protein
MRTVLHAVVRKARGEVRCGRWLVTHTVNDSADVLDYGGVGTDGCRESVSSKPACLLPRRGSIGCDTRRHRRRYSVALKSKSARVAVE